MTFNLQGKGFYIWQIRRTEGGDPVTIAAAAAQAGLTHILVKIADGSDPYNLDPTTQADLVPPLIAALRARNISVLGWHYVYGYEPEQEADIAIQRVQALGVDGYVIDAEEQYKQPGRDAAARAFLTRLRASLGAFPIALSSYRYPTYHPSFPWQAFLEQVDLNMPQVYWVEADNPADQLIRCQREFQAISPVRPIIPTGCAYLQGEWRPTPQQETDFLNAARSLNMPAANFWEMAHTRQYLPEIWQAISAYPWPVIGPGGDILTRYFAGLNAHNVTALAALYHPNAVHVTPTRTIQGQEAIRQWYMALFQQILPNASFTLGEQSGSGGTRRFAWTAAASAGRIASGQDAFGLVADQIVYHYTDFSGV